MKRLVAVLLVIIIFLTGGLIGSLLRPVHAQTGPVVVYTAPAGSTITNCGTPTLPSWCLVATGFFVWNNATQGWFSPAATVTGVAGVQKVNGVAPGATGNVTVSCGGVTPSTPYINIASSIVDIPVSLPAMIVTNTCTATGS
jgi:hypothetical protein